MSIPKLNIAFSNNNLTKDIQNIDGVAAMIGTGMQTANQGNVLIIHNLKEAIQLGITPTNEPYAYKEIAEFYKELGGNQTLYVLLVAPTVTMAQMLDSTSLSYANKLIDFGAGSISKLGVFRQPPFGYAAGAAFFDVDVAAALTASKTFVTAQNLKSKYFRVLIQGRIATESSTSVIKPNTYSNGFAGVVCGDTASGTGAAVGLTLGRSIKYAAHIKLGKVANGSLNTDAIYIGTKKLGDSNGLTIAAIDEVRATATITFTNIGVDGDAMFVNAMFASGWQFVGDVTKTSAETTVTLLATKLKTIINSRNNGYTATSAAGVVTITAPVAVGDAINTVGLYLNAYSTYTGGATSMVYTNTSFTGGVTAVPAKLFSSDVFHDAGFISFVTYPNKAGFYFGIDNMATDDDFRILAHGAVIDATAKVVTAVYLEELENEVDTNEDGTIKEIDAKHLENSIETQVKTTMGDRISGFEALVDRTVNIINTSKTKVKMRVLPKGYNTYIEVTIGLTAGN
jgi:hypothetical protein